MAPREITVPRLLLYLKYDDKIIQDYLAHNKYFSISLASNDNILNKIREGKYDICVFDHYDGPDNLKHIKYLRNLSDKVPVIMLSDDPSYDSIICAFKEGIDDYVVKPYNIEELICRINAVLRRYGVRARTIKPIYILGSLTFNVKDKTITYRPKDDEDEKTIKLFPKQRDVLALLCSYKNEVITRELMLEQLWESTNTFAMRSFDSTICNLRKLLRIEPRLTIQTIKNEGYSLTIAED